MDRTFGLVDGAVFQSWDAVLFSAACRCCYLDRLMRMQATKSAYRTIICLQKTCSFRVSASADGAGEWKLRKPNLEHTCALPTTKRRQKSTPFSPSMFVVDILPLLKGNSGLNGKTIAAALHSRLSRIGLPNTPLPHNFEYNVKEACISEIYGPRSKRFSTLRGWAQAVMAADNLNVVTVEDTSNVYKRAFVCSGAMRRAATSGVLRHVVSIDAAHCKPPASSGQFMALATWDACDHILVLAFGHVPTEDTDNWQWFLDKCAECFPEFLGDPALVIISDADKGISGAVRAVETLRGAAHVTCAQHLLKHVLPKANATAKASKQDLEKLFWRAAKVCHAQYLDAIMGEMRDRHPGAFTYLTVNVPPHLWAQAALPDRCRWGKLTSSISESVNSAILHFRYMPIPKMLEAVFVWSINSLIKQATDAGKLPPTQVLARARTNTLEDTVYEGRQLMVRGVHQLMGEVSSKSRGETVFHAVNLSTPASQAAGCCQRVRCTGMPCRHIAALCRVLRLDPVTFVGPKLTMVAMKTMHDACFPIMPVDTTNLVAEDPPLKPPDEGKPRGAPRKRRFPSWHDEGQRKKRLVHCKRCGKPDHNKRSCKEQLTNKD